VRLRNLLILIVLLPQGILFLHCIGYVTADYTDITDDCNIGWAVLLNMQDCTATMDYHVTVNYIATLYNPISN